MNFLAANKITTFIVAMGMATIVYMSPNKSSESILPSIELPTITMQEQGNASSPEPATMLLFGAGLAGFAGVIKRKRK